MQHTYPLTPEVFLTLEDNTLHIESEGKVKLDGTRVETITPDTLSELLGRKVYATLSERVLPPGPDGKDGRHGKPGPRGKRGPRGPMGKPGLPLSK